MKEEQYILAMYDIRSKQEYIYKSNKMKEIIGASYIIRDCFINNLYPAARAYSGKGLFNYKEVKSKKENHINFVKKEKEVKEIEIDFVDEKDIVEECDGNFGQEKKANQEESVNFVKETNFVQQDSINFTEEKNDNQPDSISFSPKSFERHLEEGYIGEVIYDGGGNFFVLYRDIKVYQEVNKRFYLNLLKNTYSLKVLTSYIEGVDFRNFPQDRQKLYGIHRQREQMENMIHPVNALPIVQVDYRDFMPLSCKQIIDKKEEKVSYESKQKYKKYKNIMKDNDGDIIIQGERILDNIVTQKGEESLLAIVYIDGNNMGNKMDSCLGDKDQSYEFCIQRLREYSDEIQKHYIDLRIEDVDKILASKPQQKRRFVIYAGDEVNFICNARHAYDVAVEYLTKLAENEGENTIRTSSAGIAIFHSHMPFTEAYRIAKECCENSKKWMKEKKIENASLLDFHFCQGAIGTSLKHIRKQEENMDISLPWFIRYDKAENKEKGYVTKELVQEMKIQLGEISRSNREKLFFSAKKGKYEFEMELKRIKAHHPEKKIEFSLEEKLDKEMQRKLTYDMVMVYDLWFNQKEKDNGGVVDGKTE